MLYLGNVSVLAAQKNPEMLGILHDTLKTLGFGKVFTALSGEKAYISFLENKPDIIITGWEVGKMSGIDLVKSIRQTKNIKNRQVPIIFLTGYSTEDRVKAALNSGINAYVVKPFTAKKLSDRIAALINNPPDFIESDDYFGPDFRKTAPSMLQTNKPAKVVKADRQIKKSH